MAFPESGGLQSLPGEMSAHALTHINVVSVLYGIVFVSFAASIDVRADIPRH